MDDFIFHNELSSQLSFLLDNEEKIPSPLCFYGFPGIGKTSFAKMLANKVAKTVVYYDANSYLSRKEASSGILKEITERTKVAQPLTAIGKEGTWDWCFIIDEWHNFTNRIQDSFKVPFETMVGENRVLFILCCNTDNKNGVGKILTPAIKSRCHSISFNTPMTKKQEIIELVINKFPQLNADFISKTLPDMRVITREAQLVM